jgi:hypothetical protein
MDAFQGFMRDHPALAGKLWRRNGCDADSRFPPREPLKLTRVLNPHPPTGRCVTSGRRLLHHDEADALKMTHDAPIAFPTECVMGKLDGVEPKGGNSCV